MTRDPETLNVLTPKDLERGSHIMVPPEMAANIENISPLNCWQTFLDCHHQFGHRWKADYYNWVYPRKELLVGD